MSRIGLALLLPWWLAGCVPAHAQQGARPPAAVPTLSSAALIGRQIFFDPTLSASGRLACAGCHDPRHAYAAPNARDVQLGGIDLKRPGTRAVPSLRYTLRRTPVWSKEFQADPVERMTELDNVPAGGFDWDGRFDTLHEQAASPVLAANEMANASPAAFVARLATAAYAADFRRTFGAGIFGHPAQAFARAMFALERFELEDPSFHPYSSKFDDFLDGKAVLSAQEQRGYVSFMAPDKGNCASCHPATPGADGSHPLFTDFGFEALGVPRSPDIPANSEPGYFDLGLCGPQRADLAGRRAYCGMFKTPSLRNVAARSVFFHNGRLRSLREVVEFYVTRDRDARWYSRRPGAGRYNDLPPALQGNVDRFDAPFDRGASRQPALSEPEIDDIVAFLGTLTDRDVDRHE